jgi:nicotinamidase-related amidase
MDKNGEKRMGLMCRANSFLLVLDVQDETASLVEDTRSVIHNGAALVRATADSRIPFLIVETAPGANGATAFDLAQVAGPGAKPVSKKSVAEKIKKSGRRQIVVAGIETHLSVLQTALELHGLGYEVIVIADACSAQSSVEHVFALQRLMHAGVAVATTAMALAEWKNI